MVPKQKLDQTITVAELNTSEKKGRCSPQSSQKAELGLVKTIKMSGNPEFVKWPHFLDRNVNNLLLFFFFLNFTFWGFSTLWPAWWNHVGPNNLTLNLPFVWIFTSSCLWHADSSWCSWAPQISLRRSWTEASASGPRQALTNHRISSHPTSDSIDRRWSVRTPYR